MRTWIWVHSTHVKVRCGGAPLQSRCWRGRGRKVSDACQAEPACSRFSERPWLANEERVEERHLMLTSGTSMYMCICPCAHIPACTDVHTNLHAYIPAHIQTWTFTCTYTELSYHKSSTFGVLGIKRRALSYIPQPSFFFKWGRKTHSFKRKLCVGPQNFPTENEQSESLGLKKGWRGVQAQQPEFEPALLPQGQGLSVLALLTFWPGMFLQQLSYALIVLALPVRCPAHSSSSVWYMDQILPRTSEGERAASGTSASG